ncbi:MAG TPA: hypothetical protein DDY70_02685, partial [Clostridiales bacterium]|nr:hypothetical protein [Clostridiales bacterium]
MDMKLKNDRHGIYTPAFYLLTLCAVILRTVALFIGYDTVTGYYTTALGKCADIFATVSVLFFLSYALVHRKDAGHEISLFSPMAYVPSGIVAVALPFLSKQLFQAAAGAQETARTLPMRATAILCAVLALPAMLFFLLCILSPRTLSRVRGECGILTALAFAAYAAYLYFNTSLPINAPGKLTEQCAYLLIALFFLYETRIALGRECRPLYAAFGFAAAYLAAYTALPALILYFAKDLIVSDSLPATVLTFGLFLFLLFRVLLAGRKDEAEHTPLTDSLFALAAAREESVREAGPLPYDILEAEKNDPDHLPADIFADLAEVEDEEEPESMSQE